MTINPKLPLFVTSCFLVMNQGRKTGMTKEEEAAKYNKNKNINKNNITNVIINVNP